MPDHGREVRPALPPLTREQLQKELADVLAARPSQANLAAPEPGPGGAHPVSGPLPTPPRSACGDRPAHRTSGEAPRAGDSTRGGESGSELLSLPGGKGLAGGGPAAADSSTSNAGRSWVADLTGGGRHGGGGGGGGGGKGHRMHGLRANARGVAHVLRRHPGIWMTALAVALVLAGSGIAGVLAAAMAETQHRYDSAQGFADNTAVGFEVQLQQFMAPMLALAAFIHDSPNYPHLAERFDKVARELLSALPDPGAVASLQATPQAVVRSFYPLEGNEAAVGHNLLKDPERRQAALETIARGQLTLQGPIKLKQGWIGVVPRLPIYVENVTDPTERFGAPDEPYNCSICYDAPAKRMFWGFVSCIINFESVVNGSDARLRSLQQQGYQYALYAPQPDGTNFLFSQSASMPPPPPDSVQAFISVPNSRWTLLVKPSRGWVPSWRAPMLATASIASVLIGLLVGAVLVSRRQQSWLLTEMQATNAALADEKQRMDVLLARQYNLISCVLAEGGGMAGGGDDQGRTLQEKTLARIEDMRRAIGVATTTTGSDELQLSELVGEGTFGKVYKGIWRGSTVAIKTMILPAKMSGAEKRERMAIMEAAISSSMNHPNIVQTYTYTIRPTTSANALPVIELGSSVVGSATATSPEGSGVTPPSSALNASPHVHSFEVSLVLEFCGLGSLRDALDAGAFYTADNALNYAAILDTAADVAKAMLHLHSHQVVHSDLKARNVLLKNDGSDGRGAVAKVADFGLAVRIESHDTHVSAFQGTLSHMAPEAQLGRVSKAGDVYSFGITLWEMYTGGHAFADVPRALLGHKVAVQGLRPRFPPFVPREYRDLAEECWAPDPDKRPSFGKVLESLLAIRRRLGGVTPPFSPYKPRPRFYEERKAAAARGEAGGPAAAPADGSGGPQAGGDDDAIRLGSLSYYVGESLDSDPGSGYGSVGGGGGGDAAQPGGGRGGGRGPRRGGAPPGSYQHVSRLEPIADAADEGGNAPGEDDAAAAAGAAAARGAAVRQCVADIETGALPGPAPEGGGTPGGGGGGD
ncbi:MAG: hypothetical protein J3K34DRAFT_149057 [Monoraphidium minutum]|nr:MAG: hypothetical protein J3K34DRAFT_149057 [Monoraphidium minutum]